MKIYTAPPNTGISQLGKTLPALLDEGCDVYPNPTAFNQFTGSGWRAFSNTEFRTMAEEMALGLLDLGYQSEDKVAFFMHSDVYFCLADLACQMVGMVNVPIYLTNAPEITRYILNHAETQAVIVSDPELLVQIGPLLADTPVRRVIVAQAPEGWSAEPHAAPEDVPVQTLDQVQVLGRARRTADPDEITALKAARDPHDLATIIYTSGTTGQPKGVMLSQENMAHNGSTAFSGIPMGRGDEETVLSFLPLTHIFARTLFYGSMGFGLSNYFTSPDLVAQHFREVRPTIFATVPRVLEKVYDKIMLTGMQLSGLKRKIFDWSMEVAGQYDISHEPTGLYKLKLALADKLVLSKWREALGGRVNVVISGGAALSAELTNLFGAAGVPIIQGYGLTETSPVITYNRMENNRAGTIGQAMAGVEVAIAEDGEILSRGPHIMKGYYKNPTATAETIDADGWLHTGDIGEVDEDGFFRITDRKKSLFKLSTGKYVVPQPLENHLIREPLIDQAVVVGLGHKYCTALIFPNESVLRVTLRERDLDADRSLEELCADPQVEALFQPLVDEANVGRSHWETIKRFSLIAEPLTIEGGLLTPSMKVRRGKVTSAFSDTIDAMYEESDPVEA